MGKDIMEFDYVVAVAKIKAARKLVREVMTAKGAPPAVLDIANEILKDLHLLEAECI